MKQGSGVGIRHFVLPHGPQKAQALGLLDNGAPSIHAATKCAQPWVQSPLQEAESTGLHAALLSVEVGLRAKRKEKVQWGCQPLLWPETNREGIRMDGPSKGQILQTTGWWTRHPPFSRFTTVYSLTSWERWSLRSKCGFTKYKPFHTNFPEERKGKELLRSPVVDMLTKGESEWLNKWQTTVILEKGLCALGSLSPTLYQSGRSHIIQTWEGALIIVVGISTNTMISTDYRNWAQLN